MRRLYIEVRHENVTNCRQQYYLSNAFYGLAICQVYPKIRVCKDLYLTILSRVRGKIFSSLLGLETNPG